jgi:hypothetical protein
MTPYNLQQRFTDNELPVDTNDYEAIAELADWIQETFDAFLVEDVTENEWLLFVKTENDEEETNHPFAIDDTVPGPRRGIGNAGPGTGIGAPLNEPEFIDEDSGRGRDRYGVGDTA